MTEQCRVCDAPANEVFSAKVLGRHVVSYSHCPGCGFLQAEKPYCLEEEYARSIKVMDTGIMSRNIALSSLAAAVIYIFFDRDGRFVDHGGGYGIMARLMRDLGFDYYWMGPHTENLLARGFEYRPGMSIELVTSFETFEHFSRPMEELEKLFRISPSVLFSIEPLPDPVPPGWWNNGFEHDHRTSFYSPKTLGHIAEHFGKRLHRIGPLHLYTDREISEKKVRWVQEQYVHKVLLRIKREMRSRTMDDLELMRRRLLSDEAP